MRSMISHNKTHWFKLNTAFLSLLPLLLFLAIFVIFGVSSFDGMQLRLSPVVAILPAVLLAFAWKPKAFHKNLDVFMAGVGHNNILLMCFVFLLSGAFSEVMASIGGITATVNFALYYIPSNFILPGIFVVSSFISLAMGTSMGTVASVTPIAVGICQTAGVDLAVGMGAVLSGAMFGDNLSIISDTTIAAVQTQGCEMKDKFRMNFFIALPAMMITVIVLWMYPQTNVLDSNLDFDFIKVFPYILVLFLSLIGVHVYLILVIGIIVGGIIGLFGVDYYMMYYTKAIYKGFTVMEEILILSMFIGGLSELIKHQGGMAYLIEKILLLSHKFNHNGKPNKKIGELSISALSSIADICTANNTISILMAGEASRDIAKRYGIYAPRSASLLDIFSCVFQGVLPYSAQVLLAASISKLNPMDLIGKVHYCYFLGVATLISIAFGWRQK
jgi:Na+/H+ antiporter NhaC